MVPFPALPRRPLRPARVETLRLADGRVLRVRPVDPRDAAPIVGAFQLLDEDEVRRRYLHPVKALAPEYVAKLVAPDPAREFVVVAAEPLPPGQALVGGVARLTRDADGTGADFAILVARLISGQGVGRVVLRRLCEWAQAHGVERIHGDVLDGNAPMLALAQAFGFEREAGEPGSGLVRVVLDLPTVKRRR
jgi:RimJ/RimL family protein N-acetyltransferase